MVLPCRLTEEGEFWEADEEDVTLERECSTPFFVTPYQGERWGLAAVCISHCYMHQRCMPPGAAPAARSRRGS